MSIDIFISILNYYVKTFMYFIYYLFTEFNKLIMFIIYKFTFAQKYLIINSLL